MRRVPLTEPPAGPAPRRRRVSGWSVLGVLIALVVAGPLLALPLSFLTGSELLGRIAAVLLPPALGRTVLLGVGVAAGTLVIGGGLAVLVSFYDFPGRRWLDWALVLPLAIPGYVLVFVLVGQFSYAAPLQSSLFGAGLALPGLRGPVGAIGTLSATLYPYVYVLGRSAFLGQSRQSLEVARSLGRRAGAGRHRGRAGLPPQAGGVGPTGSSASTAGATAGSSPPTPSPTPPASRSASATATSPTDDSTTASTPRG